MGKRVARRDLAKEQRWRELVAKHRDSDLSAREFCANAGVSPNPENAELMNPKIYAVSFHG